MNLSGSSLSATSEIQAADIVPDALDEHDGQVSDHPAFKPDADTTQEAIQAALAMENYEMAGNIEALMKKQLNLDTSKDILDNILNNLQGLTPDQQRTKELIEKRAKLLREAQSKQTESLEGFNASSIIVSE